MSMKIKPRADPGPAWYTDIHPCTCPHRTQGYSYTYLYFHNAFGTWPHPKMDYQDSPLCNLSMVALGLVSVLALAQNLELVLAQAQSLELVLALALVSVSWYTDMHPCTCHHKTQECSYTYLYLHNVFGTWPHPKMKYQALPLCKLTMVALALVSASVLALALVSVLALALVSVLVALVFVLVSLAVALVSMALALGD